MFGPRRNSGFIVTDLVYCIFFIAIGCQNQPKEVLVNDLVWQTDNLSTAVYQNGDSIPYIADAQEWSSYKEGALVYYEDNDSLGQLFGSLYNWYAINDPRGICPKGWRVATGKDWLDLLSAAENHDAPADDLKSPKFWQNPKAPLKNTLKFYALPGGNRKADGTFNGILLSAPYWTATDSTESLALAVYMNTAHAEVGWNHGDKKTGLACRCVKDYTQ
jgi:uncharacterized protein (TIGR02145 family)